MIRWLVVLLLIANVLFGALTRWGGSERNPDAQLVDLQMNAQQVRVIAGGQDQPESGQQARAAQQAKAAVRSVACLAWGPFAEADAERAREALVTLVPADRVVSREVAGTTSFWLQIPPLKSRADAQKKLAELKALGLTGFSIVDNDPQFTNAIDLGAFADDATARDQLAKLQQAGVRSATVVERKGRDGIEWLVREPGEAITTRVLELKQSRFPDSALGAIECPAPVRG
jgi:cell division septation protein DedD